MLDAELALTVLENCALGARGECTCGTKKRHCFVDTIQSHGGHASIFYINKN